AGAGEGAFVHHAEKVVGVKVRGRSDSFKDHFSQARLFWNSMTPVEQQHITEAFHFELGKVEVMEIRERMVGLIEKIDGELASKVAAGIGVKMPVKPVETDSIEVRNSGKPTVEESPALSMLKMKKEGIKGRKVGVLLGEGFNGAELEQLKAKLEAGGASCEIIAKMHGDMASAEGKSVKADKTFVTTASVMYDAVFVP